MSGEVVDMTSATKVLAEALNLAEELHAVPMPPQDSFKKNNAELAVVTRDLLRLAELCRLAGAEVYQQYWQFKGYNDPR